MVMRRAQRDRLSPRLSPPHRVGTTGQHSPSPAPRTGPPPRGCGDYGAALGERMAVSWSLLPCMVLRVYRVPARAITTSAVYQQDFPKSLLRSIT